MKTAYDELLEYAVSTKNDNAVDIRERMGVGDSWAQGDILITKIASIPEDDKEVEVTTQLVPGTTQGARHCLSHERVKMFKASSAGALQGPKFLAEEDVEVTHPEHGNVMLGPGCYSIRYQRAFADELKRRLD